MRILWEYGELKPAEIQEHMSRRLKNPALRSYLTILLEKGHVTRRKIGRAYYYKAKMRREQALRGMMRDLASTFSGGSTQRLMAHFIKSEKLSAADIDELKQAATDGGRKPGKGTEQ